MNVRHGLLARRQLAALELPEEEHVRELTLGIDVACRATHQASLADEAGRFIWSGRGIRRQVNSLATWRVITSAAQGGKIFREHAAGSLARAIPAAAAVFTAGSDASGAQYAIVQGDGWMANCTGNTTGCQLIQHRAGGTYRLLSPSS